MNKLDPSRCSPSIAVCASWAAAALLLCAAACSDGGDAEADAARPDAAQPDAAGAQAGIIFVNPDPTEYTPGVTDSVSNVSTIVSGTVTTTGVPADVAGAWPTVISCLTDMLAPYNVNVVEEDPGDVDHIEIAVSDDPTDIGFGQGTGGIAQATCEPLPRGIAFAFAGVFGNSTQSSCENLGWLVGHTVGIENLYYCPDVNTFLTGCGPKSFTDNDSPCGEFEARACTCGGTTQNSHQRMVDFYGARP